MKTYWLHILALVLVFAIPATASIIYWQGPAIDVLIGIGGVFLGAYGYALAIPEPITYKFEHMPHKDDPLKGIQVKLACYVSEVRGYRLVSKDKDGKDLSTEELSELLDSLDDDDTADEITVVKEVPPK